MRNLLFATTALAVLSLPGVAAGPAWAQRGAADPIERTPAEAQTQEAPAMSLGRQHGAPVGNALVTPADPAAAARRDDRSNPPGLDANPDMPGTRPGVVVDGYRIVDEPPMRQLNEPGTGATSAKIGVGERRTEPSVAERHERADPGMGDESYQVHGFDPAGDPAPPKLADGPATLPPHPDPSK